MSARFPLYLGLRNLFGRRGRPSPHLLGCILGIGLSLVPLVVVMEVADGMIEGITRRYLEVGTYHLQVRLGGEAAQQAYRDLAERIRSRPGVAEVVIERQGTGLLYTAHGRSAVTLRAVPPDLYSRDAGFRRYFTLTAGSFDLEGGEGILLGREVAQRLGAVPGQQVKLLGMARAGTHTLPRVRTFTVTGLFTTGYQELDKLWSYVSLEGGVSPASTVGYSEFIGVKVAKPFDDIEGQARRLQAALPAEARVYSWYQLEKANFKSFQTTKALLLFIMAMIVAVAVVNISSALVMVVLDKTQEIGVMKAMGARPSGISLAFLITAILAGLAGVVIGLSLGLLLAVNVNELLQGVERLVNWGYGGLRVLLRPFTDLGPAEPIHVFNREFYLEQIPVRIQPVELGVVGAAALLLSALAAVFPARAAGRIRPMEVLRRV
jgi:lipoprotein-releasing system permease protein